MEQPTYLPARIANPPGVAALAARLKEQIQATSGLPTLGDGIAATMQAHFQAQGSVPRISALIAERMQQQHGVSMVPRISDLIAEQQVSSVVPRIGDLIAEQMGPSADSLPRLNDLVARAGEPPLETLDALPVDPDAVRTLIRRRLEELISETVDGLTRAKHAAGRVSILSRLQELRFLWVLLTFYFVVGTDSPISPVVTTSVQLGFEAVGLVEKRRK